jgi:REP element-mobilizing transposase RayT
MSAHERRLPHQYPKGKALFLTWHLRGSLPLSRFPAPRELPSGRAFVSIDRYLDTTRTGRFYLRDPRIAQLVVDAIYSGCEKLKHYDLHAHAVMANHVHLLITPRVHPSKLLQSLKGFTAREANKILNRTGVSFWQRESYDHWVRDEREMTRIKEYIEQNPVKAGLVGCAEEYRWSSAWRGSANSPPLVSPGDLGVSGMQVGREERPAESSFGSKKGCSSELRPTPVPAGKAASR